MPLLDSPKNVEDLSAEKGFQWRFHCDLCGSGFETTFIPSKSAATAHRLGFLSGGLSAIGGLASSVGHVGSSGIYGASQMASQAGQFRGMSADWHREHDRAFQQAVNEARIHFKKCPKCNSYVCADEWNDEAGLCTRDAPSLTAELEATKAQVRVEQMQEHVRSQTLYDADMTARTTLCPKCGKPSGSAKFCQNCGAPLGFKECPACHHQNPPTVNFCGECGARLG